MAAGAPMAMAATKARPVSAPIHACARNFSKPFTNTLPLLGETVSPGGRVFRSLREPVNAASWRAGAQTAQDQPGTGPSPRGPTGTPGGALGPVQSSHQLRRNFEMTTAMRWRIISLQAVLILVLGFVTGFLFWGASFANSTVHDQLAAQNITFPPASVLAAPEYPAE